MLRPNARRSFAFIAASVLFVVLAFSSSSGATTPGQTPTCPHGGNYESVACFHGHVQYGDFVEFHSNTMSITTTAWLHTGHINETLWMYSTAPCTAWIEVGLTAGYNNQKNKTGKMPKRWYMGFQRPGKSGEVNLGTTTFNGVTHSYETLYLGSRKYAAYIDYAMVGTYVTTEGYAACKAAAGLEAYKTKFMYEFATTFTVDPLQWENSSGTWTSGWTTKMEWLDHGCTAKLGHTPPTCMNGTYYGSNHWADNKPR